MSKKDKNDIIELVGALVMIAFFMGLLFFSPMF